MSSNRIRLPRTRGTSTRLAYSCVSARCTGGDLGPESGDPPRSGRLGLDPPGRRPGLHGPRHELGLHSHRRELHLQLLDAARRRSSRRPWTARCRCCRSMGVNVHPPVRRASRRAGSVHLRDLRHLHGAQPHRRPLRLHPRRRLDPEHRLLATRGCARSLEGRDRRHGRGVQGHAGRADVAARATRTTTACPGRRSRSRPCPRASATPPGPATSTRSSARSSTAIKRARPEPPGGHRQRRPAVHRHHRRGVQGPRRLRHQRLPRHLGARPLPGGQGQAGHPGRCSPSSAPTPSTPRTMREDQATQARYLLGQWQEIYEQSAGKGRVGNAIGGMIFQWSDGWWKFQQEERLDIHDTNASWPNGGYPEDYRRGRATT